MRGPRGAIADRAAAIREGRATYVSDRPCKRGHVALRSVANYECMECRSEDKSKRDEWRRNNADKCRAATRAWFKKSTAERREYMASWRTKNRASYRMMVRMAMVGRRAQSAGGKLSKDLAQKLMVLQRGMCGACGMSIREVFHLYHILPLARGGANVDQNIQLFCPRCNQSKGAKHPTEWAQERGRLL